MPLTSGMRLGPYEILTPLAAGGMGEVYRARDTRLGREVALKVLPAEFASDPARRQRFEQEARAASALNHPNILAIHDIGDENGVLFMVSELVEGEALRVLIERGPAPVRKVLDIGMQIADGLATAHAAGIVHRDLKPENIMLTREGRVKILDFGLAKQTLPMPRVGAGDATVTVAATQAGVILGTVSYMSPEQARGEAVDLRSDQFSFGLILYELLTGQKAFQRQTAAETMTAILREDPPVLNTPFGAAPAPLRWVVERCLAKEAVERYSATSDLWRELRGLREHLTETISGEAPATAPAKPRRARRVRTAAAVAGALLAGFLLAWLALPPAGDGMTRYRFVPFATSEGFETGAAWSPDGQSVAYSGQVGGVPQIFVRSLSAATPVELTRSANACFGPFWSPDGAAVYYLGRGETGPASLWKIGAAGGAAELVLPNISSAAISPDGRTLALLRLESSDATTLRLSLWLSSPPGSPPKRYDNPRIAGKRFYNGSIQFSPDGRNLGLWMLLWEGKPEFWIIPLPSGEPRQAAFNDREWVMVGSFRWMPDGRHILFAQTRPETSGSHLWIADTRSGDMRQVTSGTGNESAPAISPDGGRIAFTAFANQGDLVEFPLDGKPMRVLMASSRNESGIEWSPSGVEFAYITDRNGKPEIWLADTKSGREWPIVTQKEFGSDLTRVLGGVSFSPDGQRIAYSRFGTVQGKSGTIWISAVAGGRPIRALEEAEENPQQDSSWSPDGNAIVFLYSRSGIVSLAKAAVGGGAHAVILKEKVATHQVAWSPKGDWIVYRMPDALWLIGPDGKNDRVLSKKRWEQYAWSKDGALIYAMRSEKRHYTLASIAVPDGTEKTLSEFDLPPGQSFGQDLSLAPGGKSVATSLVHSEGDIWLLEGFRVGRAILPVAGQKAGVPTGPG